MNLTVAGHDRREAKMADVETNGIDRRTLFVAAGAAVAMGAANSANSTEAGTIISNNLPYLPQTPSSVQIKSLIESSKWIQTKHTLADEFSFLKDFDKDIHVDSIVYQVINKVKSKEPIYDPYQIESLLSSSSNLLDRCLTYRREMYDLEAQAVRRALEYKLFKDQYNAQLNIELASSAEAQREEERKGQEAAKDKFALSQPSDGLGNGFQAIAAGSAASSARAIIGEKERKENVRKKWVASKEYQEALESRHTTPGHSLNYSERYNRLRSFLEQDISAAYQKLRCCSLASNKVLGTQLPTLSDPTEFGYLDYLVTYLRDLIEQATITTEPEVEIEHVVHLRLKKATKGDGSTSEAAPVGAEWDTIFDPVTGKGLLSFNLKSEFPTVFKRVRMKGVGLSVLWDAPEAPATRLRSLSAVVFPPRVDNLFSAGSFRDRPPVVLDRVYLYDPAQSRAFNTTAVSNVDPRGDWKIQISSNATFPDINLHGRTKASILDVKLHLKIAAVLDTDANNWSNFSW
jgi:hypothetical protein